MTTKIKMLASTVQFSSYEHATPTPGTHPHHQPRPRRPDQHEERYDRRDDPPRANPPGHHQPARPPPPPQKRQEARTSKRPPRHVPSGPNSAPRPTTPTPGPLPRRTTHPHPERCDRTDAVLRPPKERQAPDQPNVPPTSTAPDAHGPGPATRPTPTHTPRHKATRRYGSGRSLLRKEVIQPHLPVRLPCYDFVPIASPTFDSSLPCGLGHRLRVLPTFVT